MNLIALTLTASLVLNGLPVRTGGCTEPRQEVIRAEQPIPIVSALGQPEAEQEISDYEEVRQEVLAQKREKTNSFSEEGMTVLGTYSIPAHSGFKSFEACDGFSPKYKQYEIQKYAYTDPDGLRMVDGRYCVAISSCFGAGIGQYFDLVLGNGSTIPCLMGDLKADCDTDHENMYTVFSDCCSEFIIDPDVLRGDIRKMGDVSYAKEEWQSPVIGLILYKESF